MRVTVTEAARAAGLGGVGPARRRVDVRRDAARSRRRQHRAARVVERSRRRRALGGRAAGRHRRRDRRTGTPAAPGWRDAGRCAARDRRRAHRTACRRAARRSIRATPARALNYTLLRLGCARGAWRSQLAPIPRGKQRALLHSRRRRHVQPDRRRGAYGCAVPGDQATLHFFWLCLAFFGTFTFSFNGRLDRLDWVFYWADAVSILLLPPLFLHFTLVFPERPRSWLRTPLGPRAAAVAVRAGAAPRASRAWSRWLARRWTRGSSRACIETARSLRAAATSPICFAGGLAGAAARVVATCARSPRGASCGGSSGARRSARFRSRVGYALPYALGVRADAADGAVGDPAEPRAARVRVGDRPLPADGRRGDRQARAGLRRGAGGDSRHLRAAAAVRERRRVPERRSSTTGSSRCSRRWSSCCSPAR